MIMAINQIKEITMNDTTKKDFIGYEYKDISVKTKYESLYIDGYNNFGWNLEDIRPSRNYAEIVLKLKRDRKIRNKTELTRLQRQFDACAAEINKMENSKLFLPNAAAYGLGLVGCALMTGAVFSFLGGMIALSILAGIPAIAAWVAPNFLYNHLLHKKSLEIDPLIEEKYDEIYEVCEKANSLLAN